MNQNGNPHLSQIPNQKKSGAFSRQNLNKQLKSKPYPMPKINKMLLKWEGFKYDNSLDLDTVYYHIQLSEDKSNLCTIILLINTVTSIYQWELETHHTFSIENAQLVLIILIYTCIHRCHFDFDQRWLKISHIKMELNFRKKTVFERID